MDDNMYLIPIITSVSLFTMIGFLVWVAARTKARVTEMRTNFQTKMLDKFGTAAEFVQFAQTPEGQRLIQGSLEPQPHAYTTILTSVRRGIVMAFLGVAFLVLGVIGGFEEVGAVSGVIGAIFLALGLGYLVSAFASRKLVRAWEEEGNGTGRQLASHP